MVQNLSVCTVTMMDIDDSFRSHKVLIGGEQTAALAPHQPVISQIDEMWGLFSISSIATRRAMAQHVVHWQLIGRCLVICSLQLLGIYMYGASSCVLPSCSHVFVIEGNNRSKIKETSQLVSDHVPCVASRGSSSL